MPTPGGRLRPGLATASLVVALVLVAGGAVLLGPVPDPRSASPPSTEGSTEGTAEEFGSLGGGPLLALPTFTVLDSAFNSGLYTSLRTAPDGLPALSYYDDTDGAVRYARCHDDACADASSVVVDGEGATGLSTSLAYADGLPVISYYDLDAGAVRLAWCHDVECRRSDRMLVDAAVPDVTRTALTIAPDGRAEVAYAAGPTTDLAGLHLARCWPPARGGAGRCDLDRLDGPAVGEYVASARRGDTLVIVYRDEAHRLLRMATCTTDACEVTTPDPTVGAGLQPSVALAGDGTPVVAHLDLAGRELRLLRCPDAPCTGGETAILADTPGAGFFPTVALRDDGAATVAYYDEATRALWLAACADTACTAVERNVVDALGIVGLHISLVLADDGAPLIAYHDQSNRQLKVARCANVACAAPIEAATLGQAVEAFVGADGRPGIVYRSPRPRDIRLARCTDVDCTRAQVTPVDTRVFVGLHGGGGMTASGTPVVTYVDSGLADLRLSTCPRGRCPYLDARDLATEGNVGSFAAQSLDGDRLAVAHLDRSRGQIRLLTCVAPTCATPDDVAIADVAAGAGQLAVRHAGGRPVVAHQDPVTGRLLLTVCRDAGCGERDTTIVADGAGPLPVDLEVGADGRLWLLHRDAAAGSLVLTACADLRCRSPRATVVSASGVEASLALVDALPVMAFLEEGRGLVLARCSDRTCADRGEVVLSTTEGLTTSLATGPEGEVVVGALELTSGSPVLLRCSDPGCAAVDRVPLLTRARG